MQLQRMNMNFESWGSKVAGEEPVKNMKGFTCKHDSYGIKYTENGISKYA